MMEKKIISDGKLLVCVEQLEKIRRKRTITVISNKGLSSNSENF